MQRLTLKCLVGLLGLVMAAGITHANSTKWTQRPDTESPYALYNSTEGDYICADDYSCENPLPVVHVRWWGGYLSGTVPPPINGFTIRFFSDKFGQPEDKLYETYIAGNCNETVWGGNPVSWWNIYEYNTAIPAFAQEPGEIYWLSIQMDLGTANAFDWWGWYSSDDHWRDNSVQVAEWELWDWNETGFDLAFELSVIPAPGAILLAEQALFILDEVDLGNIDPKLEGSLLAKVDAALSALEKDNPNAAKVAMNNLKALINQVEAQTGKKITLEAATEIIQRANTIIAELGS